MNKSSWTRAGALAIVLTATTFAQTRDESVAVNLCDVFASPNSYNHKVLAVKGILFPSVHSVFLLGSSCELKGNIDSTTEAILPPSWVSKPNGKELRAFLHRGKSASVTLVGTFKGDGIRRYGPDGDEISIHDQQKSPRSQRHHQTSIPSFERSYLACTRPRRSSWISTADGLLMSMSFLLKFSER